MLDQLYEQISRVVSDTYGISYGDVLETCQRIEKSSRVVVSDTVPEDLDQESDGDKGPAAAVKTKSSAVKKVDVVEKVVEKVVETCSYVFKRTALKNTRCLCVARPNSVLCSKHTVPKGGVVNESESDEHESDEHHRSEEGPKKKTVKKVPNKKP